jgi:hypothetical protein
MAYTINLTDGTIFATIPDGTINTSSSMTLIGKNYAGYGDFLDENFIHLLENGSNTTPPGAPLEGQLWWDQTNSLLKVYNGTTFKTISAATSSSTAPTGNVTGDLWYDTNNQLLKVWTGTTWLTVGPSVVAGTGVQAATLTDTGNFTHDVIEFTIDNVIQMILSKDTTAWSPNPAISGFSQVKPGLNMSTASATWLFQGTATDSQLLDSLDSTQFLRSDENDTTSGTLAVLNDTGFAVGVDQDLRLSVSGITAQIKNNTSGGNLTFGVNIGGVPTTCLTIYGANGVVSGTQVNAQYADVAERFAADEIYEAGTVVELGGTAEITRSTTELSETVFGVISTRAAYLMNSQAGSDATHPPVAMTGRVPVRVIGSIAKGDRLVAAGNGFARTAQLGEATAFNVIGRSLTTKSDDGEGTVEAIVTIK